MSPKTRLFIRLSVIIFLLGIFSFSIAGLMGQDETKPNDGTDGSENPKEDETLPGDEEVFPKPKILEQEMVLVKSGQFIRGSKPEDKSAEVSEQPQGKVYMKAFYIDKYEVTNAMYKKFVDAKSHTPPRHWVDGEIPFGKENYPVVYVSWSDAVQYCNWLSEQAKLKPAYSKKGETWKFDPQADGLHLPTEAEWEKAARGDEGFVYPWGADFDKLKCRNALSNIRDLTFANDYETGKSPYECHNMSGNVSEWVNDWYDWRYYRQDPPPERNPTGPDESEKDSQGNPKFPYKVVRGGSWGDFAEDLRCAMRSSYPPDYTSFRIGFRCAKDAKEGE
jgi:formylglycine-generating enzyme required for sulfatase activity